MDYEKLRILEADDAATRAHKRHVAGSLLRLRAGLDAHFAAAGGAATRPRGLRLATWNVRELAERNKGGRRLDDAYWYLAEILSRFELVALQEVRADLGALRRVLAHLGPQWDFLATDVTDGGAGNGERMVFVYDTRRVAFDGVAGELTLPDGREVLDARGVELSSADGLELRFDRPETLHVPETTKRRAKKGGGIETAEAAELELPDDAWLRLPAGTRLRVPAGTPLRRRRARASLGRRDGWALAPQHRLQIPRPVRAEGVLQFARTPFCVAFRAGGLSLVLCTVHIYYGEASARSAGMQRRVAEIERLAEVLAARARAERERHLLVLGDFNIVGREHQTMDALARHGFAIPAPLREIPEGTNVERTKFYDQIAHHRGRGVAPPLRPIAAGVFDFFEHVYRDRGRHPDDHDEAHLAPKIEGAMRFEEWRTFQMSDHLPMWVELEVDLGEEVLREVVEGA